MSEADERRDAEFMTRFVRDAGPAPEPSPLLVARSLQRARAELAGAAPKAAYGRELSRAVRASLVPLPLVVAWNAAVLVFGTQLLAIWLPETLAVALPAAYVFGAAGWLALLWLSLPALARQQATRRTREVPT